MCCVLVVQRVLTVVPRVPYPCVKDGISSRPNPYFTQTYLISCSKQYSYSLCKINFPYMRNKRCIFSLLVGVFFEFRVLVFLSLLVYFVFRKCERRRPKNNWRQCCSQNSSREHDLVSDECNVDDRGIKRDSFSPASTPERTISGQESIFASSLPSTRTIFASLVFFSHPVGGGGLSSRETESFPHRRIFFSSSAPPTGSMMLLRGARESGERGGPSGRNPNGNVRASSGPRHEEPSSSSGSNLHSTNDPARSRARTASGTATTTSSASRRSGKKRNENDRNGAAFFLMPPLSARSDEDEQYDMAAAGRITSKSSATSSTSAGSRGSRGISSRSARLTSIAETNDSDEDSWREEKTNGGAGRGRRAARTEGQIEDVVDAPKGASWLLNFARRWSRREEGEKGASRTSDKMGSGGNGGKSGGRGRGRDVGVKVQLRNPASAPSRSRASSMPGSSLPDSSLPDVGHPSMNELTVFEKEARIASIREALMFLLASIIFMCTAALVFLFAAGPEILVRRFFLPHTLLIGSGSSGPPPAAVSVSKGAVLEDHVGGQTGRSSGSRDSSPEQRSGAASVVGDIITSRAIEAAHMTGGAAPEGEGKDKEGEGGTVRRKMGESTSSAEHQSTTKDSEDSGVVLQTAPDVELPVLGEEEEESETPPSSQKSQLPNPVGAAVSATSPEVSAASPAVSAASPGVSASPTLPDETAHASSFFSQPSADAATTRTATISVAGGGTSTSGGTTSTNPRDILERTQPASTLGLADLPARSSAAETAKMTRTASNSPAEPKTGTGGGAFTGTGSPRDIFERPPPTSTLGLADLLVASSSAAETAKTTRTATNTVESDPPSNSESPTAPGTGKRKPPNGTPPGTTGDASSRDIFERPPPASTLGLADLVASSSAAETAKTTRTATNIVESDPPSNSELSTPPGPGKNEIVPDALASVAERSTSFLANTLPELPSLEEATNFLSRDLVEDFADTFLLSEDARDAIAEAEAEDAGPPGSTSPVVPHRIGFHPAREQNGASPHSSFQEQAEEKYTMEAISGENENLL